jgi:hypothetical protein
VPLNLLARADAVGGGKEPVVADAVETLRQHVHQETPDELVRIVFQRPGPLTR